MIDKPAPGLILVSAEWVLENTNPPNDGACIICSPNGKYIIDGFICTYHRAEAAMKELEEPK